MTVLKFIVLLIFILLIAASAFVVYNDTKLSDSNKRLVNTLWQDTSANTTGSAFSQALVADLPAPVQGYLLKVLAEGVPPVHRIRLQQHGTFNIGKVKPQWLPFKATAHITTQPPGMVWLARLSIAPPLYIRVADHYLQGHGGLSGSVLGTLPMINATPASELEQGELMTWLAEAVWYPSALLPGNGVSWTPIDEHSAQATVDDGYSRVSLNFHFNDHNEVSSVDTKARAREVDGHYELLPWSCHYRAYEEMAGVLVPREGEVVWHLPTGEWPYMRARIDSLDYDPPNP